VIKSPLTTQTPIRARAIARLIAPLRRSLGAIAILALGASSAAAQEDPGAAIYATNCAGCHQANGEGVPGAFPPLAGHLAEVVAAENGRAYLINVLLFGLEGPITVNGQTYDGTMPAWSFLSDADIAAVLNYALNAWGNQTNLPAGFAPVAAEEVAAARATTMTPADVHTLRGQTLAEAAPAAPAGGAPVTFTAEQAARGLTAYNTNCLDCHGPNLDDGEFGGAPLTGSAFEAKWMGGPVSALFSYMVARMPPDRPGALGAGTYAAILAHILQFNGFQPGDTELPSDPAALAEMTLTR
jgi:mono/diheme cytochrome c family protein